MKREKATSLLLLVTVIWGMTFIWMKIALNEAEEILGSGADLGILKTLIVVLRFLIAFVLLYIFYKDSRPGLKDEKVIKGGVILGLLMFGGFWLQIWAIEDVTPAVSAFLTSLYVIFTAIIGASIGWQKLTRWGLMGVILATVGAAVLGLNSELGVAGLDASAFGIPEWLTVACAFLFAIHILATDRITKEVDPIQVSLTSFICVVLAGISVILIITIIGYGNSPSYTKLFSLFSSWKFTTSILCLGIFGSLFAIVLLNYCQRYISPLRAAILYALEPVWALIISIGLGMEIISIWLWLGGGALLAGNLVVEWAKMEGGWKDQN